jgi:hypothetical protein
VEGLAASYCLAVLGDRGARGRLLEWVHSGELARFPVACSAVELLLDPDERREHVADLIDAEDIPMRLKIWRYEDWSLHEDGSLPEARKRRFLRSYSQAEGIEDHARLSAMHELADLGETEVLEAYWEAQEITDDTRYDFARDMARCGHAEHLDEVRGVWIERGDLDALAAFRAVGTLDDLDELQKAIDLKAPEQRVREVMDAITERCGG